MKRKIRTWITFLLTFMLVVSIGGIIVNAKEQSGVDVQISTDKRAYQKGDNVKITVDIQNKNAYTVNNIDIKNSIPEGIAFETESDMNKTIGELKSGENTNFSFNVKVQNDTNNSNNTSNEDQNKNPNNGNQSDNQNTGIDNTENDTMDSKNIVLCLAIVVVAAVFMVLSLKSNKSKVRNISIFLCLIMAAQLFPVNNYANAAESTDTKNAVQTLDESFSVEKNISVGEETLKYQADVSFNFVKNIDNNVVVKNETLEDDEDADNDGLSNAEEKKYGTDPYKKDTDNDCLSDYDEIYKYNTDPLNEDTDGDGVLDGEEIALKLDPNNKKSDGINFDGTRKYEKDFTDKDNTVSVKVNGNASIVSTTIDSKDMAAFNSFSGLYSGVKEFHCNEKFDSAVITFNYSDDILSQKNMKAENLSIYYFNEQTKSFEKVPSTVDTKSKKVSANVEHFSSYALADSTKLSSFQGTEISLLIDNSGSMYPKELCNDSNENDVDFKRVDFANALIDKFSNNKGGNYEFSASKFTKTYTELCSMTNDYEKLKQSILKIKTEQETFNGTYIGTAMKNTLDKFDSADYSHKKYIVLLTDGETTEGTGWASLFDDYPSADEVKEEALEKGVVVFAVGLGNSVDKDYLMKMSKETGGDYFIASDANALDEIYNKIASSIEYNEVDTDNDNKLDAVMMADSQFDVKKDGFSFGNGRINNLAENGFCYGIAEFAERYYTKTLPLSLEGENINNFYTLTGEYICGQDEWAAEGYDLTDDPYFGKMKEADAKKPYDYVPKVYNIQYDPNIRSSKNPYDYTSDGRKKLEDAGYSIKRSDDKLEFSYLNIYGDNYKKSADNTEQQLFKAFARLYITQKYKTNLKNGININDQPEETINTLCGLLQNKVPSLINIGGHAVNAIRMVRDINDPNKMKLYIYDNNYPGVEEVMYISRNKLIDDNGEESVNYSVDYKTSDYEMNEINVYCNRIIE